MLPYNKLFLVGIFLLSQVVFANAQQVSSCEEQLERLGGERDDSPLPQAWELPARPLIDYLSEMSGVTDGVLDKLRSKGDERVAANCHGQWLLITADAQKLFVFDLLHMQEVAVLNVLGVPNEIFDITRTVLALRLNQSIANAGDGTAVVDIRSGKVLYAPPPSRYGAVVPALVVPGKGVLIEEAYWGTARLYRRLNFLELTKGGGVRLLVPGCVVNAPNDFSGQLSLHYALTDNGLVALGDAANGEQKTKLLQNCRAVVKRLR